MAGGVEGQPLHRCGPSQWLVDVKATEVIVNGHRLWEKAVSGCGCGYFSTLPMAPRSLLSALGTIAGSQILLRLGFD